MNGKKDIWNTNFKWSTLNLVQILNLNLLVNSRHVFLDIFLPALKWLNTCQISSKVFWWHRCSLCQTMNHICPKKELHSLEQLNKGISTSSLKFYATRTYSARYNLFFTALRPCWTIPRCQTTSCDIEVLFISILQMAFLAPTLDNADPPDNERVLVLGFSIEIELKLDW